MLILVGELRVFAVQPSLWALQDSGGLGNLQVDTRPWIMERNASMFAVLKRLSRVPRLLGYISLFTIQAARAQLKQPSSTFEARPRRAWWTYIGHAVLTWPCHQGTCIEGVQAVVL